MAEAPLPDDPGTVVPVSFKVVARAARATRATPSWPISWRSSRTASSSTAAACCISGLAARAATGAARGTSARSPRSRKSGRSPTASTRSSSRPRTASTRCAARLAQLHFDVIRFVQHPFDDRRVQGVPQQASRPARDRPPPQPPVGRPHGVVAERIDDVRDPRLGRLRPRRRSPVAARPWPVPRRRPARGRAADPRPPLCRPLDPRDRTRASTLWPACLRPFAARFTSSYRR